MLSIAMLSTLRDYGLPRNLALNSTEKIGINLIGPASTNSGLGNVTRQFANAILAKGHPVSIFDVDPGLGRSGFDLSLQSHFATSVGSLRHEVNLWIQGAMALPSTALQICQNRVLANKFNAAFVWWELPVMPSNWLTSATVFDALIAGSEYVQACFTMQIPGVPTCLAKHPIDIPADIAGDREKFGLPKGAILICTSFEPQSDPARKNPLAAVHAFRMAFPNDNNVGLVVKINNPNAEGKDRVLLDQFYKLVADDPRVFLICERLAYSDLLTLYSSCDIFISLHRAEGLGLVPLEAMRLGKPVVATGWSGNMSYMTPRNAGLVSYGFVPINEDAAVYAPSRLGVKTYWAEPDIEHAAAWLRAFANDSELRQRFASQAAADSAAYNMTARELSFIDDLVALLEQKPLAPKKDVTELRRRALAAEREDHLRGVARAQRVQARIRTLARDWYERHVAWRFEH